jgi:cellulose synthase/poly-beta-1,6-N-acetylglucosamine synthase-like glycosyltransferase
MRVGEVIVELPSARASHAAGFLASDRQRPLRPEPPYPPTIAFLTPYLKPSVLIEAAQEARRLNVSPEQALIATGAITEIAYYRALARHIGAAFSPGPFKFGTGAVFPRSIQAGIAPIDTRDGGAWLMAPRGLHLLAVVTMSERGRLPRDRLVVTTPGILSARLRAARRTQIAQQAGHGLTGLDRAFTAHTAAANGQKIAALCIGCMVILSMRFGGIAWAILSGAFGLALTSSILLRFFAIFASFSPVAEDEPLALDDADLPFYTIVVPLHREERVVDDLIRALDRLDYPYAKIEIKLMVEEDDDATIAAIRRSRLPDRYELIIAPLGAPRTKPRALNVALPVARGALLVVFDAEDRPERAQLRRVAAVFAGADPRLACVQGALVIDNAGDSWLTKLFAVEYSALFDVINPGLSRLGAPLPLGGTSNHFRIDALRQVAGWDAWNVTEDIDIGLRLHRLGYRISTLAVATDEEAPADIPRWLRQRRRWMKGWIQTLVTHSRDPARIVRETGWLRASQLYALVAGGVLGPLLGPVFALYMLYEIIWGDLFNPASFGAVVANDWALSIFVVGILTIVGPAFLGMRRRGLLRLAPWLALIPIYYALLFCAGWGALYEYFHDPFRWAKTEHGLAKTRSATSIAPTPRLT